MVKKTLQRTSLLSLVGIALAGTLSGCGQAVFPPNSTSGLATTNATGSGKSSATNQTAQQSGSKSTGATKSGSTAPAWPTVHVTALHALPVGMLGDALAVDPAGHPVVSGGYTGAYSLTGIVRINGTDGSGAPAVIANLPQPTHDAAAGYIGSALYVFGGGQSASYNSITKVAGSSVSSAGTLPDYLSDAKAVPYHWHGRSGQLILGGYNGQVFNRTVRFASVAQNHLSLQGVFTMPVGLRYTAAAAIGSNVAYAGGLTTAGSVTNDVYVWKPGSGVKVVAHLPAALQKAAAFAVGGRYLVVAGGLLANGQPSANIYGIDLVTKKVKLIGHLPTPLADMGYAQFGQTGYLTGGMTTSSDTHATNAAWKLQL